MVEARCTFCQKTMAQSGGVHAWATPECCSSCAQKQLEAAGMLSQSVLLVPRMLFIFMLNAINAGQGFVAGELEIKKEQVQHSFANALAGYRHYALAGVLPRPEVLAEEMNAYLAKQAANKGQTQQPGIWKPGDPTKPGERLN